MDLRNSYLPDTSCSEILTFLSKSIIWNNITKPSHNGTTQYYSVHYDGSTSTKTMDEKKLFIIKTMHKGEEEPNEAKAERVKPTLENWILKIVLKTERKQWYILFHSCTRLF